MPWFDSVVFISHIAERRVLSKQRFYFILYEYCELGLFITEAHFPL